jgi:transcriptional regulator GlxA family with amidase domain
VVSERHLTRLFQRELGITPGQYVTRVRVEAARILLESCDVGVEAVARRCGFGSDETMRRVFLQVPRHHPNRIPATFRPTRRGDLMSRPVPRRAVLGGAVVAPRYTRTSR